MNFYKALIFGVSTLAVIGGYADNGFSLGEGGSDDEPSNRIQNLRITDPNNNNNSDIDLTKKKLESDDDSKMEVETTKTTEINPTEKDMEFLSGLNKFFMSAQSTPNYPTTNLLPIYEAALHGEVLDLAYLRKKLLKGSLAGHRFRILTFLEILSGKYTHDERKEKIPGYLSLFQDRLNALTKGARAIVDDEEKQIKKLLKFHQFMQDYIMSLMEYGVEGVNYKTALEIYKAVLNETTVKPISEKTKRLNISNQAQIIIENNQTMIDVKYAVAKYLKLMGGVLKNPYSGKNVYANSSQMLPYEKRLLGLLKGDQPTLDNEIILIGKLLYSQELPDRRSYMDHFEENFVPKVFRQRNKFIVCNLDLDLDLDSYFKKLRKHFSVTRDDLEKSYKTLNGLIGASQSIDDKKALSLVGFLDSHALPDNENKTYLQKFVDVILSGNYLEVSPTNLEKLKTYMSFMAYDDRVKIASLPDLLWNHYKESRNWRDLHNKYEPWQIIAIHQMLASNDYVFYVDDSNKQTQEGIQKLIQSKVETFATGGYKGYTSSKSLQNQQDWTSSTVNDTLVISQNELQNNKAVIESLIKANPDLKLLVDVKSNAEWGTKKPQLSKEILDVKGLKHLTLVNTNGDITETPKYDRFNKQSIFALPQLHSLDMRGMTKLETTNRNFMSKCEKLKTIQLPLGLKTLCAGLCKKCLPGDYTFIFPNLTVFGRYALCLQANSLEIIAPKLTKMSENFMNLNDLNYLTLWTPAIQMISHIITECPNLLRLNILSFPKNGVDICGGIVMGNTKIPENIRKELFKKYSKN